MGYLCRLIIYGALFGVAADAVLIAAVLSAQDPFTLPSHLVIKKPEEYAEALFRSYKTRKDFDGNLLSEPIMLRNLFVTWLTRFNENKKSQGRSHWYSKETPRASYLRFSQQFARETGASIVPKRCVHLSTSVLDTATRFRKYLVEDSKAAKDVDHLLDMLSTKFFASPKDIFASDSKVLRVLLTAAFAPNFMIGSTKIRAPNAVVEKKKKQKMEPNKMESLFDELIKRDMNPLTSVCVPLEIPRWVRRSTERLLLDLKATLEMMLAVGEGSQNPNQYVLVKLDKDWKKMYVEVRVSETEEGEEKKEEEEEEGTPCIPKGRIALDSVPTAIHLLDQFGAGRFKFLTNLRR